MPFIVKEQIDVKSNSDFLFTNLGSICLLLPLTPAGEEWMGDHLPLEHPETQFWGLAIVIEPRYVGDILAGISDDGLVVSSHLDTIN